MTGKRGADSELNRDNWDREGSDEEVGTFKRASDEVLATRQIKVTRIHSNLLLKHPKSLFRLIEGLFLYVFLG